MTRTASGALKALQQVLQLQDGGPAQACRKAPGMYAGRPPGRLEVDCKGKRNAFGLISAGLVASVASRIAVLRLEIQPTDTGRPTRPTERCCTQLDNLVH